MAHWKECYAISLDMTREDKGKHFCFGDQTKLLNVVYDSHWYVCMVKIKMLEQKLTKTILYFSSGPELCAHMHVIMQR